jgi:hypothetical protein
MDPIKVDHRSIRVEGVSPKEDYVGLFDPTKGLIQVDRTLPPEEQAETLIHELLHAIWSSRHIKARVTEEEAVSQLASGLATILVDNPGLLGLLMSGLQGLPLFEVEA